MSTQKEKLKIWQYQKRSNSKMNEKSPSPMRKQTPRRSQMPFIPSGRAPDLMSPTTKNMLAQQSHLRQERNSTPKKNQKPVKFDPKASLCSMATVNTLNKEGKITKNVERILNELDGVFQEFSRVTGILKSRTIAQERKKLVDQTRWRRKFKGVFDWHKCVNFDVV